MKKIKEYYICDRCKKEINKPYFVCDGITYCNYELCKDCKETYDKFIEEYQTIQNKFDELNKKYKFGKWLPKDN